MKKLTVNLNRNYDIVIGKGLLSKCGELVRELSLAKRLFIVSDSNVAAIYLDKVKISFENAGFEVYSYIFEAGEQSKTFDTINKIVNAMAKAHITRRDTAVALGGGVTGDMTGFASAIYMRGIDFVQLSTSLLSDIDSSVGGKTGCDLSAGKNLIGAFHQPIAVIIDTDTLATLPKKYYNDGMGEAIKYGFIRSSALYNAIMNGYDLDELIYECVDIKRVIVENDEFEHGERKLLNFGHTLAHAIEKYYNFSGYSHGEAVAIGMVMMTRAAENNGLCEAGLTDKVIAACQKCDLPTECDADMKALLKICLNDKKAHADSIDIVISDKLGSAFTYTLKTDMLENFFGVE